MQRGRRGLLASLGRRRAAAAASGGTAAAPGSSPSSVPAARNRGGSSPQQHHPRSHFARFFAASRPSASGVSSPSASVSLSSPPTQSASAGRRGRVSATPISLLGAPAVSGVLRLPRPANSKGFATSGKDGFDASDLPENVHVAEEGEVFEGIPSEGGRRVATGIPVDDEHLAKLRAALDEEDVVESRADNPEGQAKPESTQKLKGAL
jgi:hypothetical protein